jgi:hypothetical protein
MIKKLLSETGLKSSTTHDKLRATIDSGGSIGLNAWRINSIKQDLPRTGVSPYFGCKLFLPVLRSVCRDEVNNVIDFINDDGVETREVYSKMVLL